jgi:hypothetical protein
MVQMIAQPQVMPMLADALSLCRPAASAPSLGREFLWFRVWLFAIIHESLTG